MTLLSRIPRLDDVLNAHGVELGDDFNAYRNHTYRVVNLCVARSSFDAEGLEKIVIAAAFHDIGIWTGSTFDYLGPSIETAKAYLAGSSTSPWTAEITEMILQHHKISPYRSNVYRLVEPFRKSDWVDVSRGLITFGLPRSRVNEIFSNWPSVGFHKRLVQLELRHLRTHPWDPLPMIKL